MGALFPSSVELFLSHDITVYSCSCGKEPTPEEWLQYYHYREHLCHMFQQAWLHQLFN